VSHSSTGLSRQETRGVHATEPTIRVPPTVRLLSYRDLREIKGLKFSRQWIDKLVKEGRFPKPIRPAGGAHKAWFEHEIDAHLNACAAERNRDQVA
jgi:predicted DNA-binding transcriptional regulator AlpA